MKKSSLIIMFFLLCILTAQSALAYPDYKDILARSRQVNKGLKTFKVPLRITAVFMGMACPFRGYLYYKKPDRLHLSIPMAPSSLRSKKSMFQDAIPRSLKPEDYAGTVLTIEKLDGKVPCYLLELIPLKDSKVEKIHLWIETNRNVIMKSKVFYNNKATVLTLQSFRQVDSFLLPDKQYIEFDFPAFKADAHIDYKDYSVNVPVDEAFNKSKPKSTGKDG